MKKIFPPNETKWQAGITIIIFDKMDFKLRLIRDVDILFWSMEHLTKKTLISNIYALKPKTPDFMKVIRHTN